MTEKERILEAFRCQGIAAFEWAFLGDEPSKEWGDAAALIYAGDKPGPFPDPPWPPWWPNRNPTVLLN